MEGDIPHDLPRVLGDREQLIQVFSNLAKNAKEACSAVESPRVVISARGLDGVVEVSVQDNGPGFSGEVEAKLFTPYFTTKSSGTGLGLAIVHRIVEEHHGTIRVDSKAGVGTRFVVEIPAPS